MPSEIKTGCSSSNRVGWIAIGYSTEDAFWYSSEGVFNTPKAAKEDLLRWYTVDVGITAVKIKLDKKIGQKCS